MEWQVILALLIVIPVIVFPLVFIWYLNIGGIYVALKEGRLKVFRRIARVMRIGLAITVPAAAYALAIWFSLGHFGWQVALAVGLVLPVVAFVPVLIWVAVVSGMYLVIQDVLRRRVPTPWRRTAQMAEERVTRRVT